MIESVFKFLFYFLCFLQCPKGDSIYSDRESSRVRGDGLSKMGRDGAGSMIICHNCGGRGHMAYECPSARLASCGVRRY
ncbi:BnaC02g23730D [Brassica napus]|uniref:BnaC02g23730D protein n=1 Tax=Brassica napus TaxID=3708 RepID=A0A078FKR3_BRANA|nr:BnaC02g23730D [Brassica napus]